MFKEKGFTGTNNTGYYLTFEENGYCLSYYNQAYYFVLDSDPDIKY